MTVLMQAAINGHAAIIKLLLRAGADKEAEDEVNLTCTLVALIAHKDVFFKRKAIYK
jgi:ankyrin repeat protein